MKRERLCDAVVFTSQAGEKTAFHGVLEVHQDIKAGSKLRIQLYPEVSGKGAKYFKGPCYPELVVEEAKGEAA